MTASTVETFGAHRMADPAVRLRTAVLIVALLGLAWASISLVGQPSGAFTQQELPHLSGLPFAPPQIQRRIAPQAPGGFDLQKQLDDLQRSLNGQPSPAPSQ